MRSEDETEHAPLLPAFDGYSSFDDTDTPAEVFAVWRIQRRVATGYLIVFLAGTLGAGLVIVGLPWASDTSVFGGFSPGFVVAAFGLYVFFLVIAVAAASLANAIEDRMMGATALAPPSPAALTTPPLGPPFEEIDLTSGNMTRGDLTRGAEQHEPTARGVRRG